MSQWTHICGTIRLDSFARIINPGFDGEQAVQGILGPMSTYSEWRDDCRLPNGSEGSLQYGIHVYDNNENGLYWASLTFWGDLRDFGLGEVEGVRTWWENTLDSLAKAHLTIRQAVLQIEIEYQDDAIILTDREHQKRRKAEMSAPTVLGDE